MFNLKDRLYYKALAYVHRYKIKKILPDPSKDFQATADMAEVAKVLSFYFPKVDMLIDIGAHKGKFTHAFTTFVKTGKVVCIEPNQQLHAEINQITKGSEVQIFSYGLAEKEGKSEYYEHEDPSMNSIVEADKKVLAEKFPYDNPDKLVKKEIDIITLDQLFERNKISSDNIFIKIDTQGSELNILKGSSNVLKNVKGCLIEHMFVNAYKSDYTFQELLNFMISHGFECAGVVDIIKRQTFELSSADFLFVKK